MSTGAGGTTGGGPDATAWRRHPRTARAGSAVHGLGAVEHVAAGVVGEVPGGATSALSWVLDGCLWAVGRLPDEVVARGSEQDLTALLSWGGVGGSGGAAGDGGADVAGGGGAGGAGGEVEAEVRVSAAGRPTQWLVVTCRRGEVELRPPVFSPADVPGELWVSDGTGTERTTLPAVPLPPSRPDDPAGGALAALIAAVRTSAEDGGAPVRPGS